MYNYVESERKVCVIILSPRPPSPSRSCKALRAFKDRRLKITITIFITTIIIIIVDDAFAAIMT